MSSKPKSIRFNVDEMEEWSVLARARGMTFNKWVVLACRGQGELEKAENQERADAIAEREVLQRVTFPEQGEKCTCVAKGQWCYTHGKKRW